MSTLGIKGKVGQTVKQLNAMRSHATSPRDITLREFVAEEFKVDGKGISLGKFMHEIDVDPARTRVHELMADDDKAHLMSEVVRDGVRQGMGLAQRSLMERARKANVAMLGPVTADGGAKQWMQPDSILDPVDRSIVQSAFYPDLTITEETVSSPTVKVPKLEISDALLKDSNEAATIEEGDVTYGDKDVTLVKKARGLKVTYESIMFNSLNLAQVWFRHAGQILGHTLNALAISTLVNGDVSGGSEAAAIIGVEDTNDGITWRDIARAALRASLIGQSYTQILGNETTALNYLDLDEMKRMFIGSPLLPTTPKTPLVMPRDLYASAGVPANQVILNDPASSLVQLTAMPLMVETEKIVSKQIEASYISIMTGFAKVRRTASVIVDGSIAYSGNQFPSWMAPYA